MPYPDTEQRTGFLHTHHDTQLSIEDTLNTPLDYENPDAKLTTTSSGSISVKVISSGNGTSFDIIESQLENPLVGIKGPSQKDINVLRQELQGIPSNENSLSLDREDAEPRSTSFTHYPPGNANGHSSMYPLLIYNPFSNIFPL